MIVVQQTQCVIEQANGNKTTEQIGAFVYAVKKLV